MENIAMQQSDWLSQPWYKHRLGHYWLDISFSSGFPFKSMRVGGHYHYAINRKLTIKTPLCKQNHNIPSSPALHDTPTNALQCCVHPSVVPRPRSKEGRVAFCAYAGGNNFSCGWGMRNKDPMNSGLISTTNSCLVWR